MQIVGVGCLGIYWFGSCARVLAIVGWIRISFGLTTELGAVDFASEAIDFDESFENVADFAMVNEV